MDPWIVGVISMAILIVINTAIVSYNYGKLNTKVEMLCARVESLTKIADTVQRCPYCQGWHHEERQP